MPMGSKINRKGRWPALCAVACVVVLAATARASPEVERLGIVDRSIEFHGGPAFDASRVRLELCSASGCSRLDVGMSRGVYDYRVTGPYREGERTVRVTNRQVEHWLNGERQAIAGVEEEQRLRDWVMARVYFCFLPYRLNDPNVLKQDLGLVEWRGRKLHRVKVTFALGSSTDAQDEFMYWLDPESARVEMFAYTYERNGGGLRFRRDSTTAGWAASCSSTRRTWAGRPGRKRRHDRPGLGGHTAPRLDHRASRHSGGVTGWSRAWVGVRCPGQAGRPDRDPRRLLALPSVRSERGPIARESRRSTHG